MALIINEEQTLLKNAAKELLQKRGAIATLRKLRDTRDAVGLDKKLWNEMAANGWAALVIPEAYGGLDFGYVGLGQILEEAGRTLTPSPLISTVLLSGTAITLAANHEQKEALLRPIGEGQLIVAFAHEEGRHHKPDKIDTSIRLQGDSFVLNGKKVMVLDGHIADKLLVVARSAKGEIQFVVVDATQAGVKVERTIMMDSRNVAKITFDGVKVPKTAILDHAINMNATYHKVLDIGRIGLAAEMLGGIQEAFERTVAYLKTREQFGVKIGTFQALQHRAAKMLCEVELCKSLILKALQAIDKDADNLALLASTAKAKLGETYNLVSNEAIQLFGGIGMTDDEEIGFFLKRARVLEQLLGGSGFHLGRYAELRGY